MKRATRLSLAMEGGVSVIDAMDMPLDEFYIVWDEVKEHHEKMEKEMKNA